MRRREFIAGLGGAAARGWPKSVCRRQVGVRVRMGTRSFERLPGLVIDLVGRDPAVIITNTLPAALAAKEATKTIPWSL